MRWTASSSKEASEFENPNFNVTNADFELTVCTPNEQPKQDDNISERSIVPSSMGSSAPEISDFPLKSKNFNFNRSRCIKNKKEWVSLQIQRAMIADEDGDRAIHIAVAQENVRLVQQLCLLMKIAKISLDVMNNLRQTPLHVAVLVQNEEIVNILVKAGASIHFRDKRGNTPLKLAIKYFSKQDNKGIHILKSLLSHSNCKAILNVTDCEGLTAIHDAVSHRNFDAVRELHHLGADINVADGKSGRTGLIYAVLAGDLEMVELLLQCKASVEHQDYSGQSSLCFALQTGNKNLIRLLEKNNNNAAFNASNPQEPPLELQLSTEKDKRKIKATQEASIKKRKKLKNV